MFRRFSRAGTNGEDGVALVIAMMVMGVVISLSLLVVTVSIRTNQASGRDRQRTVTLNAAEAGVDAAYAEIQSSGVTLPCTWPATGAQAINSSPDKATARANLTYYKADGTALGHCPTGADTGANSPATAVVDGFGTANALAGAPASTRHMQALINLTPVYGDSMNKAIFSEGNLTFGNQTTLTGNNGANADVYTNSNFDCANNENFAGSVNAQGNITVSGQCTIAGDAWANGSVSNSSGSSGSVGGRVLSATSTISLPNNFSVNSTLLAAGAISWGGCSASGKCFPNTSVAPPPTFPFPILRGDAATLAVWAAKGYTIINDNTCATIKDKIISTYAQAGTKTLVRTTCAVNFSKDKDIPLSNDLAIFASGGLSSSQQVSFSSSPNGTSRNLHWVVPYDAATRPCATPAITTDNLFNFSTDVNMFVYSPCNIDFSNNSDHLGQVYGGSNVSISNQFTMQYRPVPVWGIDPSSLPTLSYKIDIVYKRETR